MPERILKYTEAINEATNQIMNKDRSVFVVGLGVTYKNGADGTTGGLKERYPDRVFDVPVSENGFTGMAVGAAINGLRPIVHHGRIEFALLAYDPIITQAPKWNYMFGGGNPVPITFRINVGRQWGNGPQHTQAIYSLFGNIPGLKVVIPSSPKMAKGLLLSAVEDNNPTIVLEPRWLFNLKEDVPEKLFREPLDKAKIWQKGNDVTLISYGDGLHACREALNLVNQSVSIELIDLVSINPIDYKTIFTSVNKTGRIVFVDTTHKSFCVGSEIIAKVAQNKNIKLRQNPINLACPDVPCPTSPVLTEAFYPTRVDIANSILKMFGKNLIKLRLSFDELNLAPSSIVK